eukprot:642143-Pleurochrysis_carterae.AAC.2
MYASTHSWDDTREPMPVRGCFVCVYPRACSCGQLLACHAPPPLAVIGSDTQGVPEECASYVTSVWRRTSLAAGILRATGQLPRSSTAFARGKRMKARKGFRPGSRAPR